jgi:hypothetical protein
VAQVSSGPRMCTSAQPTGPAPASAIRAKACGWASLSSLGPVRAVAGFYWSSSNDPWAGLPTVS